MIILPRPITFYLLLPWLASCLLLLLVSIIVGKAENGSETVEFTDPPKIEGRYTKFREILENFLWMAQNYDTSL